MRVPIAELQVSQLYISEEKLRSVQLLIDKGIQLDPIPVKKIGGKKMMTDGHTRAVAYFLRGETSVEVEEEEEDLDWDEYRICVNWCETEGIGIAELSQRIISVNEYQKLWLDRCRKMRENMRKDLSRKDL